MPTIQMRLRVRFCASVRSASACQSGCGDEAKAGGWEALGCCC
ncbi:hypothetical protein WKI68_03765 [Streptomyces sp. MS1.HAVA.3]|uniref:Uncharacterized protein n=1 Tax=Streptomyces caledonius TaxID=3134107 RepID=A0ABU8U0F8_9ACTN